MKRFVVRLAVVGAVIAAGAATAKWLTRRAGWSSREDDLQRDIARFEGEGGRSTSSGPGSASPAHAMMRIGIIGTGNIGGTLAKLFVDVGHDVMVSNSRGPDSLAPLVADLGSQCQAGTAAEAAAFGELVVVSIPFGRYRELPTTGFFGKVEPAPVSRSVSV